MENNDKSHIGTSAELACYVLRTGRPGCEARFYPGLYRLCLQRNGVEEVVDLGYSGSRLLERLLCTPGELVDRETLLSYAWAGRVVSQGSLNQQVYTLRQLLGDDRSREIIQTLPRRGYVFNRQFLVGVQTAAAPVLTSMPLPPAVETVAVVRSRPHWAIPALAGAAGVVLGFFMLGFAYLQHTDTRLVSAEVEGGKVYILYVNTSDPEAKKLVAETKL